MDWVAVGLCEDVPAGTVVPRRVLGTDLAIWRSATGKFHAWGDRCPHRGMRLSHGFVRGEVLSCIYHGWQYGTDGACGYIPAHPNLTPPKTICAQTYPCNQHDDAIWVTLSGTDQPLPDVGGCRPVRSLDFAVPAADIAAWFGQSLAPVITVAAPHDLHIALQPSTDNACMVHAFAPADQDRKAVSRYLEQIRADIEEAA
ncbi:Rieske (2Fe-2S) protein [Yoonia sp. SS1-5]|uniref:Rieske (2Fe-2S) protein n=1 Tax=Yoonia rhodophyticola TaxID=3137370 RepID=A0AAN0NM26_9RHOB